MLTDSIESTLNKIRKVYFTLSLLGIFFIMFLLSGSSYKYGIKDIPFVLFSTLVYISIYWGLKKKKAWINLFIRFFSVISILTICFKSHSYQSMHKLIIFWVIAFILVLFYIYQIYFFSKREVRTFMKEKGVTFF